MYKRSLTPTQEKKLLWACVLEDIYDKLFCLQAPRRKGNVVKVTCEVVEPLGSEVYLYLNTGKHTFIARVGAHDRPPINQDMDPVFDMSKVHFLTRIPK